MSECKVETLERVMLSMAYAATAAFILVVARAAEPLGFGWLAWALAATAVASVPLSLREQTYNMATILLNALFIATMAFFTLVVVSVNCANCAPPRY